MTAQSATAMQPQKSSSPLRQGVGDLFDQFDVLYQSISRRAFELYQGNGQSNGHDLDDWLRAESEFFHPVYVQLAESEPNLKVRAEVPGFSAKDLEIKVEPRRLVIAGKRESSTEKVGRRIRSEWPTDQIFRAIELPTDVDLNSASATLKDGVLTVDLAKAQHAKAVHIELKAD